MPFDSVHMSEKSMSNGQGAEVRLKDSWLRDGGSGLGDGECS